MAFVEQNKRWLLPLLGLAVAGVLWLNLTGQPWQAAPATTPGAPPPPQPAGSDGVAEPEAQPPAPDAQGMAQAGPGPVPGNELKALEAPAPVANDPAPLLVAGRLAVTAELRQPPRPPLLHPDQWRTLPQPAMGRPAAPAPARTTVALALPPRPEFLFENAAGRMAWLKGRGYQPGDALEGGYTLRRISATGIVVSGPDGDHELLLNSARATAPAAPGQPRKGDEVHP